MATPGAESVDFDTAEQKPFHVLMVNGDGSAGSSSACGVLRLDSRLRRDYLSRRHRAFQEAGMYAAAKETEQGEGSPPSSREDPWCGASVEERALVSCCAEVSQEGAPGAQHIIVPGSLAPDKIVSFVGLTALHCHDVGSRALALAILERSQEADELEKEEAKITEEEEDPASEPPPQKKVRVEEGSPLPQAVRRKEAPQRLTEFVRAGGLRLLSRWLVEATTPIPEQPKDPPGTAKQRQGKTTNTMIPAPSGPLLLPLLQFLAKLPFDKEAIMKSRINKEIRNLGKQIDSIVKETSDGDDLNKVTDPVTGGLEVVVVQKALRDLMETWEAASKQREAARKGKNPFAELESLLESRLDDLNKFGDDDSDQMSEGDGQDEGKPEWLVKFRAKLHSQSATGEFSAPSKSKKSMESLARKERENERSAMMKEDLEKAQEERRKLLQKLRDVKQREKQQETSQRGNLAGRKRVQWADGFGPASKMRKREELEGVFEFHPLWSELKPSDAPAPAYKSEKGPKVAEADDETESNTAQAVEDFDEGDFALL
jgi:hypothetical protein